MGGRFLLTVTLLCQAVFLSMVIASIGVARNVWFSLFWIVTIATLIMNITQKVWEPSDWIVFGAFAASVITGVLFSLGTVHDVVGVGVSVTGLLFVAAAINALPGHRRVAPPGRGLPDLFYSVPGTKSYHRKGCRVLSGKDDLVGFVSEDEALRAGLRPCKLCN